MLALNQTQLSNCHLNTFNIFWNISICERQLIRCEQKNESIPKIDEKKNVCFSAMVSKVNAFSRRFSQPCLQKKSSDIIYRFYLEPSNSQKGSKRMLHKRNKEPFI